MHYQAPDNSLHFLENDSFKHLLPEGSVPISEQEADAIRAAATPAPDPVEQVKAQINGIERETLMNRAVREFMLAQAEAIASGQGYTPGQLYAVNLGYRKVKDVDNQIAGLRAQIGEL